jgi:hypothetical protein
VDGFWLAKVGDWAWLLVLGVGAAVVRLFGRVDKIETRLDTLEGFAKEVPRLLREVRDNVETGNKEHRENHRMLVTELLKKVPPA